jgi:PPOX class probable F420-dependent enzyme
MGITLNDEIRRLLDGRHFAVLATINPDGGPQTSTMWVARDGDDVLFSTVAGRRKHRNLERDPRCGAFPCARGLQTGASLRHRGRTRSVTDCRISRRKGS